MVLIRLGYCIQHKYWSVTQRHSVLRRHVSTASLLFVSPSAPSATSFNFGRLSSSNIILIRSVQLGQVATSSPSCNSSNVIENLSIVCCLSKKKRINKFVNSLVSTRASISVNLFFCIEVHVLNLNFFINTIRHGRYSYRFKRLICSRFDQWQYQ